MLEDQPDQLDMIGALETDEILNLFEDSDKVDWFEVMIKEEMQKKDKENKSDASPEIKTSVKRKRGARSPTPARPSRSRSAKSKKEEPKMTSVSKVSTSTAAKKRASSLTSKPSPKKGKTAAKRKVPLKKQITEIKTSSRPDKSAASMKKGIDEK